MPLFHAAANGNEKLLALLINCRAPYAFAYRTDLLFLAGAAQPVGHHASHHAQGHRPSDSQPLTHIYIRAHSLNCHNKERSPLGVACEFGQKRCASTLLEAMAQVHHDLS